MKIKTIFYILGLAFLPALLIGQTEEPVRVSFSYNGVPSEAKFVYSIMEAKEIKAVGLHKFQYAKDRQITIKFTMRQWSANITDQDRIGLTFDAPQASGNNKLNRLLEQTGDSDNLFFDLKGAENTFQIKIAVKEKNSGAEFHREQLTLTFEKFEKKEEKKQEEIKEENDPVPQPPVIVETAEDKAWNAARTLEDYEAFSNDYPASAKYGKALKLKLIQMRPLKCEKIGEVDSIFTYKVYNVSRKPTVTHGAGLALTNPKWENYEYTFDLVLRSKDDVLVQICDAENPSQKKKEHRCRRFEVGNPLFATMTPGEDSLRFTIKGGKPPYSVFFRANDDRDQKVFDKLHQHVFDSLHHLAVAVADLKFNLDPGTYLIEVNDKNDDYYEIPSPPAPYVIVWKIPLSWYIAAGAGLGLIVVFSLYRRLSARKKVRRRDAMLRQIQENKSGMAEMAETDPAPPEPSLISIQASTTDPADPDRADPDRTGNFSIRPRANEFGADKAISPEVFQRMVQPGIYLPLHLDRLWANSALKTIYFNRESILELDQFLRVENTSKIKENDKDIPEIGGMLLGKFTKDSQDNYEVTVEKFAPIASKSSNVYRLEFSVESFALDLTAIQDEFPELLLVGWFHTHPGHGLFLSPPDLKIHNHFRELYQFAMEIDSLTQDLDTGFFTRQQDGKINNQDNLRPGARWFAWTEIEKYTRKSR